MGLTNWKQSPEGKILKSDIRVAKNYLSEQHIKELNRIVSAYLDFGEPGTAADSNEDDRLDSVFT